ncbi:MAG TPA: Ppx/GppA family phosphatase [Rhizomicrobium sp.]|jgi:exopolyphosphatase/guanosine-5'-triphosphate,3'-diphosphate pyrophosphatase|nr:Ppx/GppA family phosphatase [Rhizomicrobium sp.]
MSGTQAPSADARAPSGSRPRPRPRGPVAVVDIGSNSVRLVIYEAESRAAATLHNEKSICAIGRDMVTSGRLHAEGCAMALEALARFKMLADGLNVAVREAVATAAARDASNGADFVRRAEAAWGAPVRVLSGEDEARIAAEGVVAGIPQADGLVADLGGGSLDMVSVRGGKTGDAYTLPFGPLRLMDGAKGDADKARKLVDEGLEKLNLHGLKERSLYAVGGIWRSFARVDMEATNYPLHVLQEYEIPRGRALRLCKVLSGLSRKSVEKMKVVSKRRAESLPYGAIVLERLLLACDLKSVAISAYGLREGILYARLTPEERGLDPLLEFAEAANARQARNPGHAAEMFAWMAPLFFDETAELRRIRQAACLFSDVAWRRHPDDRALGSFGQVLSAPFAGASHRARALIASSVFHRYSGDEDFPRDIANAELLDKDDEERALAVGLACRLAFALSASSTDALPHYRLRLTPAKIVLDLPRRHEAIAGEPVQKRLGALAAAFGRKGEIQIG